MRVLATIFSLATLTAAQHYDYDPDIADGDIIGPHHQHPPEDEAMHQHAHNQVRSAPLHGEHAEQHRRLTRAVDALHHPDGERSIHMENLHEHYGHNIDGEHHPHDEFVPRHLQERNRRGINPEMRRELHNKRRALEREMDDAHTKRNHAHVRALQEQMGQVDNLLEDHARHGNVEKDMLMQHIDSPRQAPHLEL